MISGPFASALDVAHVAAGGERYVPLVDPYNAAMHLGHMASYRHALLYAYGRQVLDLGCGTGYGAHYLASYGARQVVAVDVDPVALDYARQAYDHPRVEYQRCDGQRLPYADASFDFVFSSQAIEHVPDPEAFLREINRLLKQNGACLIITPNRLLFSPNSASGTNEFHISEMSPDEFEAVGRAVFPRLEMAGIPQNCLQLSADGVLGLKPNDLLRLEDYRVQQERLEECENIVLLGYKQALSTFSATLPDRLLHASTNLGPCFWDADTSRWLELGLFPPDTTAESQPAGRQQSDHYAFRSPLDHLCRIEVALNAAGVLPIEITLRDLTRHGEVVIREAVQSAGKRLSLTFPPLEASAGREFCLEIRPSLGFLGSLWRGRRKLPQFAVGGDQLCLWTFHQTLPPALTP